MHRRPFHLPLLVSAAFLHSVSPASTQEGRSPVEPKSLPLPDEKVAEVKPNVEQLDEHRFRIGKITFDKRSREIRVPTKVNMTDGLLEFLLVHENGKVHESLLLTDASATHLNLAFTLLRYRPSRELYALPSETGGQGSEFPDVPEDVRKAARVAIDVEWSEGGKTRRVPANEWIQHTTNGEAMPSGPWVYGGSEFYDGKFAPESTGDLIAIFLTNSALVLYPGSDNMDDTVWLPYPKRVPAEGSDVTLIFSPSKPTEIPLQK